MIVKATRVTLMIMVILIFTQGCGNGSSNESLSNENESIDSVDNVQIGGISKWIQLKGADINKPVLLVLHGGPGFAMMPLFGEMNSKLEQEFVIVNWDQRGSGKSFSKDINPDSMTLDQLVEDANELTNYLKEEFNQEKIFILGHSFGTLIGMKLIVEYPENYEAYFGTEQVIDFIRNEQIGYDFALESAISNNDTAAINTLKVIGRPDAQGNYKLENGYFETSKYIEEYGGDLYGENNIDSIYEIIFENDIYKDDEQKLLGGYEFSQLIFDDEAVRNINLINDIKKVDVPVYFLLGRNDFDTPSSLVEEYYDVIDAPYKELIWFEKSAHFPFYEESEKFNKILLDRANR